MPGKDWKNAEIVTAGVDVGSVGSKAVIMIDGEIYSWSVMRTGSNSSDSAKKALGWAMENTGLTLNDFNYIVGTGYGQDVKAIRCDETGKVVSFLMNDKCAAGTGRGMEIIADLLKIPIEDVGKVSLSVTEEPEPVSSTCVVFAKTEAVGLLRKGWPKEKVLAAYIRAMAIRMSELIEKVGCEKDFVITILNSGKNLLTIINDILDFSKIEAGKMDIDITMCSLEQIISTVNNMMKPANASIRHRGRVTRTKVRAGPAPR
ncbi:MAG: BadF/BadG/BcrA/BcrD ATPase family protein, partial [Candidatus Bathyarchaeota archaeon]